MTQRPEPKTIDELIQLFKPPMRGGRPIPYVLFARMQVTGTREPGGQLVDVEQPQWHCLDCSGSHAQEGIIDDCLRRGWTYIKHWFPTTEQAAQLRQLSSTESKLELFGDVNHFLVLEDYLARHTAGQASQKRLAEMEEENRILKQTLAAKEANKKRVE